VKRKEQQERKIETKIRPIHISYEIIWPTLRNAPKKAYLELDAQPEMIIP
jgi:hypothetical protein